jgi:hypothetical protein
MIEFSEITSRKLAENNSHAEVATSNWRYFANGKLRLSSILPRPNPNAMPANKIGRGSIWVRRREAARLRDLRT